MQLTNLAEVRTLMMQELDHDIANIKIYYSTRLKDNMRARYIELLRQAIREGNDVTLAQDILRENCLVEMEVSHRNGKPYDKRVPVDAHETLAEGEFNRFYCRGVCLRAIANHRQVIVYRAKEVNHPRAESEAKIGTSIDPTILLNDLRTNIGVDLCIGIPAGPNSGLSIRIA